MHNNNGQFVHQKLCNVPDIIPQQLNEWQPKQSQTDKQSDRHAETNRQTKRMVPV